MKKPFHNAGHQVIHIGSTAIWPGETREVDEHLLPSEEHAEDAEPASTDPLLDLLDNSVPEITAHLAELSDEQLRTLMAAEEGGKTRKGVIKALNEELLRRAGEMDDDDLPDPE